VIVLNAGSEQRRILGICQVTTAGERRRVGRLAQAAGDGAYRVIGLDPYRDNVVLCLDGDAVDLSPRQFALQPVGGAVFASGVAAGLGVEKYFQIADPGAVFTLSGNFTIEWRSKMDSDAGYYGTIIAASAWVANTAWITYVGWSPGTAWGKSMLLRRQANVLVSSLVGVINPLAAYEFALVCNNGVLRFYVDGSRCSESVTDAGVFNFSQGGNLMIGYPPAGHADEGIHSLYRIRITKGVARYTGDSYAIPESYT
jgi:hypothetical protein